MECPGCQTTIIKGWKVCPTCGIKLPEMRECRQCGQVLDPQWKACPFCGMTVSADTNTQSVKIQDSVVKEVRLSDVSTVFNFGAGDISNKARKPELEYEEHVIAILRSGGNLQTARNDLDKIRERLGLTLGQANGIETDCIKMYVVPINKQPQISEAHSTFTTNEIGNEKPDLRFGNHSSSDFHTPSQYEYIEFFTDISRRFVKLVPIRLHEPDGRYYFAIFFGRRNIHFEWYFGGRPRNRLGVELHFESDDRRWNQRMLHEVARYNDEIERLAGEKVILQYEWGSKNSRLYVERTQGLINEDLKRWAVEKMIIFYRVLQPRLNELK